MTIESTPASYSLVERIKGILLRPSAEWMVIAAEPATVQGLFTRYAMILAAIGPAASIVGAALFMGWAMPFTILAALVGYVLSLIGVFVISLIIDALAPSFGGMKDRVQAAKTAVYAWTAVWVAAVFNVIPMLGWLGGLLGLYSLYLLYLGLPRVMRAPEEKALGYTAVVVIAAIVVWAIIWLVIGSILAMGAAGAVIGTAAMSGHW